MHQHARSYLLVYSISHQVHEYHLFVTYGLRLDGSRSLASDCGAHVRSLERPSSRPPPPPNTHTQSRKPHQLIPASTHMHSPMDRFIKDFDERQSSPDFDSQQVQDFMSDMEAAFRHHPVFSKGGPEVQGQAVEVRVWV